MQFPKELRYTKEHEWIRVEDGVGTVGITDFAQHELGDVVFVELPADGTPLAKGHAFGVVESVKAVSDIYAPVSGVVAAANTQLGSKPELINQDPYGAGWLIKITLSDAAELSELMDVGAYCEYASAKEH